MLSELQVDAGDLRHEKTAPNAFRTLELPGCDFALLAGFKADGCVLSSAKGAEDRALAHALLRGAVLDSTAETAAFVERILPLASFEVVAAMLPPR